MWSRLRLAAQTVHRASGGLWLDLLLYALSTVFAAVTAASSTLLPHRAWGGVAAIGYLAATVITAAQLVIRRPRWRGPGPRAGVAGVTWAATALLPVVIQSVQRAAGRTDRAQEEVMVIEDGGRRLLESGSPYLDRAAIAGLPPDQQLLGYMPYQPGMGTFGLPRALDPAAAWWSDARVWFALVTVICLAGALLLLRRAGAPGPALVRALQVATVLPICALTLATGGNDLAVLALCLLALALARTDRLGWAGLAVGAAAALKLFAWPVALVLALYALRQGRGAGSRFVLAALALPVLTALPVLIVGPGALIENVVAFPFGRGLVTSPAASPLPGHLIATSLPGGSVIAAGLLAVAAAVIVVLAIRRPPDSAAAVAQFAGWGLLVGFLLLPATRFGYLLYPAAILLWAPALVRPQPVVPRQSPRPVVVAPPVAPI